MERLIYFVRRSDGAIKIGWSSAFKSRLKQLEADHGALTVLARVPGEQRHEAKLHRDLAQDCLGGEWFAPSPEVIDVVSRAENGLLVFDEHEALSASEFHREDFETPETMLDFARKMLSDTSIELALQSSRMNMHECIGEKIGVSASWVRKTINKNSKTSLPAHVYMNILELYITTMTEKVKRLDAEREHAVKMLNAAETYQRQSMGAQGLLESRARAGTAGPASAQKER